MTNADRQRLAAILGMLGSNSAGERDNAARLAEELRKQHSVTWQEMINGRTVYVDREIPVERTVYVDRPVYVDREVYVWPGMWQWLVSFQPINRGIAIVLGGMPLVYGIARIWAVLHS
jgi:hypothetical protein